MARTWTHHQQLDITIFVGVSFIGPRIVSLGSAVYFVTNSFTGDYKVWKYDGATLTDISGTTFPDDVSGDAYNIVDIAAFNGSIFVCYGRGINTESDHIWRYSGSGQTWVDEYALVDESPDTNAGYRMDSDSTYLFVVANQNTLSPLGDGRMHARNTSGSWVTAQMPGGAYDDPAPYLVGASKGYASAVLGQNRPSDTADYRVIQRGSPSFSNLSGSDIGDRQLCGVADGLSFFTILDGSNYELRKSSDWGVTLAAAGNLEVSGGNRKWFDWTFKVCAPDAIMVSRGSDGAGVPYTWDSGSGTFVADGDTFESTIYGFFVLAGTLYCITTSGDTGKLEVYEGGPVAAPSFYYGRGNLQKRSALPFPFLNIGGLSIPHPFALLGSGASGTPMVAYASPADSYATWTDFTGALSDDPINCFDATPWGDAAAASGSGEEDETSGGFLADKC